MFHLACALFCIYMCVCIYLEIIGTGEKNSDDDDVHMNILGWKGGQQTKDLQEDIEGSWSNDKLRPYSTQNLKRKQIIVRGLNEQREIERTRAFQRGEKTRGGLLY